MKAAARHQFKGFDDEFLTQFAAQQQRHADDLQRQAAGAQRAADAARKEIRRRKKGDTDGQPNRA